MPVTRAMATLRRRQIDQQLGPQSLLRDTVPPELGWVTTIRQALGMSMRQLAARLGVSSQAVAELEKAERRDAITVAKLRQVANALSCDVVVAFVPRQSLQSMVEARMRAQAAAAKARVAHTMRLEAQEVAEDLSDLVDGTEEPSQSIASRTLWDD